jgi:hypothetical protein
MNSGAKYSLAIAAFLVVAAALGGRATIDRHAADAAVGELIRIYAHTHSLALALRSAQMGQAAAEHQLATLKSSADETKATDPSSALSVLQPGEVDPRLLLKTDPQMQVLNLAWNRAEMAAEYGPLFRALGLTTEQVARFEDLKLQMMASGIDIAAAAQAQHLAEDDPAIKKMRSDSGRQYMLDVRALLGPGGAKAMVEFERTIPVRNFVAQLQSSATLAGTPLTAEQAERLTMTAAQLSQDYRNGQWASMADMDWNALSASAQTFLTPQQADSLVNGTARISRHLDQLIDLAKKTDRTLPTSK